MDTSIDVAKKFRRKIAKNIFLENEDEEQVCPLLIMVSWSNGKLQHLIKYGKLYKEYNCTIIYVLETLKRSLIFHRTKLQRDCLKLDDLIDQQISKNQNRKVLFHLFSFPGPVILNSLMNYNFACIPKHINCLGNNRFRRDNNKTVPNISGVVFDSCILNRANPKEFGSGTKAMTKNPIAKPFFYLYGNFMSRITPYLMPMFHVWCETFKDLPGGYPQLVIFSRMDPMTSYELVLEIINHRKENGEDVEYRLFEDSKHVNHLRKYPDEYKSALDEYFQKVIDLPLSRGRKVWKSLDGLERDI